MSDFVGFHLTGLILQAAIDAVLIAALGLTVLQDAGETATALTVLGVAATGLIGGYGFALWRLTHHKPVTWDGSPSPTGGRQP